MAEGLNDDIAANLLDGMTDGLLGLEPVVAGNGRVSDFRIVAANSAAARIMNGGDQGMLGRLLSGVGGVWRVAGVMDRLVGVLEGGRPLDCLECLAGEGKSRWYRLAANQSGDGLVLTIADLTGLRGGDGGSVAGVQCLGDAIDRLDEGFALFDARGRLVMSNSRFRAIFGADGYIAAGTSFEDMVKEQLSRRMFPDALGRDDEWLRVRLDRFVNPGRPFEQQVQGGRWFRVAESRTGDGGVVSLWTDITGLKQAESRVDDALHNISGGFALWDAEDRLVMFNDSFRRFYPLLTDRITQGVGFEELLRTGLDRGQFLIDDGDEENWMAARMKAHRNNEGQGFFEQHMNDGRWIQVAERRTRDGGVVSLRTDISELKRGELQARQEGEYYRRYMDEIFITRSRLEKQGAELVQLAEDLFHEKEKAETSSLRKTQFLANLSHELRTPMNAILGFAEMLKMEMFGPLGSERYVQYAEDIYDSGMLLLNLINDVLDMTKIEAGKKELHREAFSLRRMADECLRLVYDWAEKEGVVLINGISEAFEPAFADQRALKQSLLNLLSNGIKFTPRGGSVKIGAELEDHWQVIRVADTGIGISEEDLPKLANPFVRATATPTRKVESTGLGLALTKALLEMHGGSMSIKSRLGHGTTIELRLPRL